MHDFPLLINITITIVAALIGGLVARLLKLPTLVGYLLAGVVIGPFTPGFIGDMSTIQHLAELGVIFLLFGVGLHFSISDLWKVRHIVIPGALIQLVLITAIGVGLAALWGWSLAAGILIGIAIAIASTVVMTRNLMDQGLLHTPAGHLAMGWLVMEDVVTVLILVLLPALSSNSSGNVWGEAALALLKAVVFTVLMLFAGSRIIPWILHRLAYLRSRELFVISIVVITVGTAVAASVLFGVSLALGAFLAGMVVRNSMLSRQIEVEILPFRDAFGVLFFVSVGMLVNPVSLIQSAGIVLLLVAVIVVGKFLLTLLFGLLFPQPLHDVLVVSSGRSQIGEFSFILGQTGVALALLSQEQYSLLLAGAMISIILNPFLFRGLPWMEKRLQSLPFFKARLGREQVPQELPEQMQGHVIVVGYGRVGKNIVQALSQLQATYLVVDLDVQRIEELARQQVPVLYGDAANSEILSHAGVAQARAVVVTVPDETAAEIVTASVRMLAPQVPLVARVATQDGVKHLLDMGANEVIHPELEGAQAMMRQTLALLGYPESQTQTSLKDLRDQYYKTEAPVTISVSTEGMHP